MRAAKVQVAQRHSMKLGGRTLTTEVSTKCKGMLIFRYNMISYTVSVSWSGDGRTQLTVTIKHSIVLGKHLMKFINSNKSSWMGTPWKGIPSKENAKRSTV